MSRLQVSLMLILVSVALIQVWQHQQQRSEKKEIGPLFGSLHEFDAHHRTRAAELIETAKALNSTSIVLLGDSITEGLNVDQLSASAENFGIGGDTTYGLYRRISDYKRLYQTRCLIVTIGVNDLMLRSDKQITSNYRELLKLIPTEPTLIVHGMLPTEWPQNERIPSLNDTLSKLSTTRQQTVFIDARERFVDENGTPVSRYFSDGLHLSEAGYTNWAGLLKGVIQQHCQQSGSARPA